MLPLESTEFRSQNRLPKTHVPTLKTQPRYHKMHRPETVAFHTKIQQILVVQTPQFVFRNFHGHRMFCIVPKVVILQTVNFFFLILLRYYY